MNLYSSMMKGLRESKASRRRERAQHIAAPHKPKSQCQHTGFFRRVLSVFGNRGDRE